MEKGKCNVVLVREDAGAATRYLSLMVNDLVIMMYRIKLCTIETRSVLLISPLAKVENVPQESEDNVS